MVDLQDHPADVNFDMGQPIELSDAYVSDIEFDQSLIPILSEGFLQADDIINQQPIKFNSFNQRQIMSQMNLRNNKDPNKLGQPIKIQDLESIEPITIIPDLTYTGMQGLNISPLKNILGPLNQSGFNDTTDNDLFNDDVPDNDLFTEDDVLDEDELSSLFETFSNHLSSGFNLKDHMGATNDPKNINNDVLNNAISSQFCHYIQLSNNQNNNNNNKLSSLDSSSNSNNTILSTNDEEEDEAHKYYSGNVSHNNNSFNTSANNSCNSANASLNNSALSLHCAKIKDDSSNIINNNKNNLINNKNNNNTSNNNNKTQVIRNLKIHMDNKTFTQTKGTTYKKKYILSNRGVGALVCISPSDDGPANTTTPQHTNKQQHLKNIKAPRQHLQQMLCNKQPQHFKHSETKQHVVTPQQPHHFPKDFHHIPLSSTPKTHKFSEPSLIHNYKQKNNNNSNNKNNEINNGHIKAGSDVSHKHHREVFRDRLCNIPSYNNNNTNNNNSNTNNNNNINRNSNNVLRLTTNNRANILNNINNKKNIFQHHPIHHNNNNNNNTNYHNNNNNTNYINNNKNNRISLSPTNHPKPPTTHLSTRGKQMGSEAKGHEDNKNNKDSLPNILKRKQRNCTKTTFTPSKFLNHPNNTTPVSKRIKNNSLSNQFDSLLIHLPCKKQIFPDDDRNNKNNNIFGSINNNNNNKDNFVVNNNNNNFVVNNNSNTNNPLSVNTSNNSSDLLVANKNNISANNSTSTIKDDVSNDVTAFIITKNFKNKKNILNSSRKGKKNSKLNSSHLSPSTQLLLECSNNDQSLICIETPSKILSDDDDDILNFKLNTCTPGNNNNNNNNKNNNDNNTNVDDEDVDKDMVALDDVRENGGQTVSGGGDARQNLFKSKSIDASDEDRNADDGDKKERVGKVQRCVSYTEGSKDEAFLKVACCDNSHLQQLLKQARDVLNNNNKKKEQ